MTLVIGMMNRTFAVQVSDRRLTVKGVAVDEESNKAVILTCRDGRFLVGYSGIAQLGTFKTKQWLLDVLYDIAPPDYSAAGMAKRFVERASYDFANIPVLRSLDPRSKGLSVMWTGFLSGKEKPLAVALLVSNFQDFDEGIDEASARDTFTYKAFSERPGLDHEMTWVQPVGRWDKVDVMKVERIRRALLEARPARAPIGMAVELIRDVAARNPRCGVGSQITSIVLPADPTKVPLVQYHTSAPSDVVHMPSYVFAIGPDNHAAYMDPMLRAVNRTRAMLVQKVGRNHPCPCLSGQRYKRCHGRFSAGAAAA